MFAFCHFLLLILAQCYIPEVFFHIYELLTFFREGNEDLCFIIGLSSVEAYNIKSNEWFHVAPMNTRRSSVGVGVVGGRC